MQSTVIDPPRGDQDQPDPPPHVKVTRDPWNLCIGLVAVSRCTGTLFRSAERVTRHG